MQKVRFAHFSLKVLFSVIKTPSLKYTVLISLTVVILIILWKGQKREADYFLFVKENVIQSKQGDWQQVSDSKYLFSVYSAFGIISSNRHKSPKEIVITATIKTDSKEDVTCVFSFNSLYQISFKTANGSSKPRFQTTGWTHSPTFDEVHSFVRNYAGALIHCPLPQFSLETNILPDAVSIVAGVVDAAYRNESYSNLLPIQYKLENADTANHKVYKYNFSACVLPHYNYSDVVHFLEWIEFNKLMGVEQFSFYNNSLSPDISCILHEMINGSDPLLKVNVYPYHENPVRGKDVIRGRCSSCAVEVASNDCSYRHRGRLSKYMLLIDLDEYIMPRRGYGSNYAEMMEILDRQNNPLNKNIAEYRFLNGFFPLDLNLTGDSVEECFNFKNDPMNFFVCRKSFLMTKVMRNDNFQNSKGRVKCITKPEGIKHNDHHFVINFEDGYEALNVSETIAFLHHYRRMSDISETHRSKYFFWDDDALHFGSQLVENLAAVMQFYMEKCNFSLEQIF